MNAVEFIFCTESKGIPLRGVWDVRKEKELRSYMAISGIIARKFRGKGRIFKEEVEREGTKEERRK